MNNTSKSILFAEFHPWESKVKVGGHHYAEQFADEGWRLLWLANFLNLNRLFRSDEYDRSYYSTWRKGIQVIDQNIFTYTPFPLVPYLNLPILSSLIVARNSLRWCVPSLSNALARFNFNPIDILWISQPRMYSLVSIIQHKKLVYRMFDDVQHFAGEPKTIVEVEKQLCRKADIVFATSHLLVDKARKFNHNVVYLPNGVDFDRFSAPVLPPTDLIDIPKPRLLYVGAIAEWFDFDLIFETAKINPDWSFVLIGPWHLNMRERFLEIKDIHNIYYLGPKPPDEIPAYIQHADLGLIPFIVNNLTNSVSPIKLFEYSAAGLPVVSPNLSEVTNYDLPIIFYEGINQFVDALEKGLTDREKLRAEFIEFGKANSWTKRYVTVMDSLM